MVKGGWGRVVWLPTFDAENPVRYSNEKRPFVSVSRGGQLLPEVREVIGLAAKYGLTLETGHSSAAEGLMIVREAKRQGVAHIVVTHAMLPPVKMTVADMRPAAADGASSSSSSTTDWWRPPRRSASGNTPTPSARWALRTASWRAISDSRAIRYHPDRLGRFFSAV